MKGFWIGVFATVLASVLGFLAIEGLKTFSGPDREISHTEFTTKFFFGSKKAVEWEKNVSNLDVESLDNRDRLTASVVVIENIGKDALQNQQVIIKPKYDDSYSAGIIDFKMMLFQVSKAKTQR